VLWSAGCFHDRNSVSSITGWDTLRCSERIISPRSKV
jgi:hypothetical protein